MSNLYRDKTYNPPLKIISTDSNGNTLFKINKSEWRFCVKTTRGGILDVFQWLDSHAGLEWDFCALRFAQNSSWVETHNRHRGLLELCARSQIRLGHGSRPTGLDFCVYEPKVALLVKLTFEPHIRKHRKM